MITLLGLLNWPPSLERSEKLYGPFIIVPVDSLVDSMFELSENVAIAHID